MIFLKKGNFMNLQKKSHFTKEEQAYRRGYCHGFVAAQNNSDITREEVDAWRHGQDETAPPGSALEGIYMEGLRENNKDEFFLNKQKKMNE
jgi:hypothetical protein